MNQKKAEILIFFIVIGWGSSYLFMKMGLASLGAFNLIALRFGLAFLIMLPILFYRRNKLTRKTIQSGIILGTTLFGIFTFIMLGLHSTSTSNAGFLVSLTVVFVPILEAIHRKKAPKNQILIGIILAVTGIGFLTLKSNLSMGLGDLLCIMASFIYSVHIWYTGVATKKVDALSVGILQLGFASLFGLIFTFTLEQPRLPHTTNEWIAVVALGLICSAFGFVMQPVAQKYTTPTRTGLIFTLEPVFAALFGMIFLGEVLSAKGYLGAAFVFCGVIVANRKEAIPCNLASENTAQALESTL